ncbi:Tm-1-like ATP-binding domain-containing protein [Aquabacterium sp.]|uniref:Tm-1-like ATP-binding domain-containing protein n=1 Tax=Aquabacterium sp. TaxID=1872578 RepID=UPI002CEF95CF|nr:Tm-1-like ATP-binding domain-containing protein [Aquabacterium sp.]HSW07318.1 Tm-1-like ATP-binding domain-containing protein [Aquabacterium sp.]
MNILLIGTVDTKSDEMAYMREVIAAQGGRALVMDVGVLGRGGFTPDIANTDVALAAGVSLQQVINSGDENSAMILMARGATALAVQWHAERRIDGLLVLGGTMGTDLALDVANALPPGFPKVVVSTIAYSQLLPPDRIPPDLIMVLWAGGLYGLNSLCRSALAQAAGAVMGAARSAVAVHFERPLVGMTSLGSSAMTYMKTLKPALEARGFDLAVFHATGMGGRAFEALAAQGRFVAVMDFCLQELVNHLGGSCVSAGPDRLRIAGRAGVPQIVAPGATDMLDFPAWSEGPARAEGWLRRDHNRLIASACIDAGMRREVARAICSRLAEATGPTCLLLPTHGIEGWDRPGQPLHDPDGLAAFVDETRRHVPAQVQLEVLDAHINDPAFCDAALRVFDQWVADGRVAARPWAGAVA